MGLGTSREEESQEEPSFEEFVSAEEPDEFVSVEEPQSSYFQRYVTRPIRGLYNLFRGTEQPPPQPPSSPTEPELRGVPRRIPMRVPRRVPTDPVTPTPPQYMNFELLDLIFAGRYEEFFRAARNRLTPIPMEIVNRFIQTVQASDRKYRLKLDFGNSRIEWVPITTTTQNFLMEILGADYEITEEETYGSDRMDQMNFNAINDIEIVELQKPKGAREDQSGAFFPYINTTDLDLSRYQIWTHKQAKDGTSMHIETEDGQKIREHCLIDALLKQDVPQHEINMIKTDYERATFIGKKDLKPIAEKLGRNINLHFYDNKYISRNYTYQCGIFAPTSQAINIAIYKDHYFSYEATPYSRYFIEHYEELYNVPNPYDITRISFRENKYVRNKKAKINSLQMIHRLFQKGKFVRGDMSMFPESLSYKEITNHKHLDNIENEQKSFGKKHYTKEDKYYFKQIILIINEYVKEMDPKIKHASDKILIDIHNKLLYDLYPSLPDDDEAQQEIRRKKEDKAVVKLLSRYKILNSHPSSKKEFQTYLRRKYQDHEIAYADSETFVKMLKDFHRLFLLGGVTNDQELVSIFNVNDYDPDPVRGWSPEKVAVFKFLDKMTDYGSHKAMIYWHNVKYDYHVLEAYLSIYGKCQKDNNLYSVSLWHRGVKVEFIDSFKIIPMALEKMPNALGLVKHKKKEAIAYKYYDKNTSKQLVVPIKEYMKYLPVDERKIFKKEVKEHPSYRIEGGVPCFSPLAWYMTYLEQDCQTLKEGIQKFDEILLEITDGNVSVHDRITISSLTHLYMSIEGAFDGLYEIRGNLKNYINKAIVGGRVHANEKYLLKETTGKIEDFDGCSLYPSAISRLCRPNNDKDTHRMRSDCVSHLGLAKGKAKRLIAEDFDKWEDYHYSVMTVKINKINKNQQMPFIAVKDAAGTLDYRNTPPEQSIVVDSITLRDYIDYHEIEYEIQDGVYWDEGGNTRMGEIIEKLYSRRLECKARGNVGLSQVLKLMMNSSYGKTIIKPSKTQTKIIPMKEKKKNPDTGEYEINDKVYPWENYIYNNHNLIKKTRLMNNEEKVEVEIMSVDNSSNLGHVGCAILSMSKRIMNEVFNTANDIIEKSLISGEVCKEGGRPIGTIYYQDTDSMHIDYESLQPLANEFRKRYGRELIGKQLGQFHSDFELEGAVGEVHSRLLIILGKKTYFDDLYGHDTDGNLVVGHHYRTKGMTKEGMEFEGKKYSNGVLGIYQKLCTGVPVDVVMNPFDPETNKDKFMVKYEHGRPWTKELFPRRLQFGPSPTVNVGENE